MTTYLDSSVALRIVLGASAALPNFRRLEHVITSALMEVECLRTLDRLQLVEGIAPEEIGRRRESVYELVDRIDVVALTPAVLSRASQPLPVALKPLDALHLATAMVWRESEAADVEIATHDEALAIAARAVGFKVVGA